MAAGYHPDHTAIAKFRGRQLKALSGFFVQVLMPAKEMLLVKPGQVALDGPKVQANVSNHKAMSYERMCRKLKTNGGKAIYSKRKESVETVFGQIKQGRGCHQLFLRGLEKMKAEWRLICLGHNVLKMWRNGRNLHAPVQECTELGKISLFPPRRTRNDYTSKKLYAL